MAQARAAPGVAAIAPPVVAGGRLLLAASVLGRVLVVAAEETSTGNPRCPCLASTRSSLGAFLQETPSGDTCLNRPGETYCWPETYGAVACKAHDEKLQPDCADPAGNLLMTAPQWCIDHWCYVDPTNCDTKYVEEPVASISFPGSGLHYSYETCGAREKFAKWQRAAKASAPELKVIIEGYSKQIRDGIEHSLLVVTNQENEELSCTGITYGCDCGSCEVSDKWSTKTIPPTNQFVDFGKAVLVTPKSKFNDESNLAMMRDKCLSSLVAREMRQIARSEYNDEGRIAYIYYGSQGTGAIMQWPAMQWCPTTYDTRFRPWYSTAASGPKDVILVLDKSGSMKSNSQGANRWAAVQRAAKSVLMTLGNADFATVITFSSAAYIFDDEFRLHRMTNEKRAEMTAFIDSEEAIGGTNFQAGLGMAFRAFSGTIAAGRTSGCIRTILFLTDGEDTYGFKSTDVQADFSELGDVTLFTYSFGTNIGDQSIVKQLACQNRGVWNRVPDGGDIETIMASYYQLFAHGIDDKRARWIEYEDIVTKTPLISSCFAVYDRRNSGRELYGVSCVDLNVIVDLETFKNKTGYEETWAELRGLVDACAPMPEFKEEELQALRRQINGGDAEAVCQPCDRDLSITCLRTSAASSGVQHHLCLFVWPIFAAAIYPLLS